MIDPNIYVLTRAIHDRRNKAGLKHQRYYQPFSNDWRVHSGFWLDTLLAAQGTEGSMLQERIRYWFGGQLMKWGFTLQGYRAPMLPHLPKSEPCNS